MILTDKPSQTPGIHIGYWHSEYDPTYPHPKDFIDESWSEYEKVLVAKYIIDSNIVVQRWRGSSRCRLCSKQLGSKCHSDGTYVWPEMFEHYILEHSVKPPQEFIAHCIGKEDAEKVKVVTSPYDIDRMMEFSDLLEPPANEIVKELCKYILHLESEVLSLKEYFLEKCCGYPKGSHDTNCRLHTKDTSCCHCGYPDGTHDKNCFL